MKIRHKVDEFQQISHLSMEIRRKKIRKINKEKERQKRNKNIKSN